MNSDSVYIADDIATAYLALCEEELRVFGGLVHHSGRCGPQMMALMRACEAAARLRQPEQLSAIRDKAK